MPRISSFDGLRKLLDKQLAVASRGQLLALGMADRAMQYRLRPGGPWQAVLPGVYLAVTGTPTFEQKEMAALLYAGPGSVVTGPAALTHHGIRVPGAVTHHGLRVPDDLTHHDLQIPGAVPVIDVLVPVTRQRIDLSFVRLHRTARMPARPVPAGPVRLAPAPRAVADTAWQLTSPDDVRVIVTDALQSGQCTVSQLTAELNEGPIRGSAAFRSVLADLAEGSVAAAPP